MALERVQKILAKTGIAARRKAEELIVQGSVTINGKVAQLGDKADLGVDAIKVDGKLLRSAEPQVYLAFFKPKGVLTTLSDPEGRPTLQDYLRKVNARVFPVGRLEFNSEGLLLLTNDGDFAAEMQKKDDIPRAYQVKIKGHPHPQDLTRLAKGARVDNQLIKPHSVRLSSILANKALIHAVFLGSGAADVKGLFETKGFLVERMTRTSIGHLTLSGLRPGEYRFLKKSQVEALLHQPELGMRLLEQEAENGPKLREEEPEEEGSNRSMRPSARPGSRPKPRVHIAPAAAAIIPASDRRDRHERRPARGPANRTARGEENRFAPSEQRFSSRSKRPAANVILPQGFGTVRPRGKSAGGFQKSERTQKPQRSDRGGERGFGFAEQRGASKERGFSKERSGFSKERSFSKESSFSKGQRFSKERSFEKKREGGYKSEGKPRGPRGFQGLRSAPRGKRR